MSKIFRYVFYDALLDDAIGMYIISPSKLTCLSTNLALNCYFYRMGTCFYRGKKSLEFINHGVQQVHKGVSIYFLLIFGTLQFRYFNNALRPGIL